jgi:glycosyltransferase involved in cell wall biosynthesis
MKITYYVLTEGGCDWYRAVQPLWTLRDHNKDTIKVNQRTPVNIVVDVDTQLDKFQEDLQSDIIFIPRVMNIEYMRRLVAYARDYNPKAKVVLDYDDNVFDVSPFSSHYVDYGTQEYKISHNGDTIDMWIDGQNINLFQNAMRLEHVKQAVRDADMVITTTNILADVYRPFCKQIKVIPNCIDPKVWQPLDIKKTDEVRLFWSGGHSHYEDIYQLKEVLPAIAKKYPKVKFVFMGCKWDSLLKGVPEDRIEFHPWVHTQAYPYKTMSLNVDIGIIPLRDTNFNRCKSAIKWIEYGSIGIPCVATYIPPYSEMAKIRSDNGIFIRHNDKKAWIDGISMLIENADLRKKMGATARQTVLDNFDIHNVCKQYQTAFEEVLYGGSKQPDLIRAGR